MIDTDQAYVIELMMENELRYSKVDNATKLATFKSELDDIIDDAYSNIVPALS